MNFLIKLTNQQANDNPGLFYIIDGLNVTSLSFVEQQESELLLPSSETQDIKNIISNAAVYLVQKNNNYDINGDITLDTSLLEEGDEIELYAKQPFVLTLNNSNTVSFGTVSQGELATFIATSTGNLTRRQGFLTETSPVVDQLRVDLTQLENADIALSTRIDNVETDITNKISADGSVTTHSDVSSAGSGQIISVAERNKLASLDSNAEENQVNSVNGEQGDVVLDSDDISEGNTNLYLTEAEKIKISDLSDNIRVLAGTFNGNSSGILYTDNFLTITWLGTNKQPQYELKSSAPISWDRNTIYAMKVDGSSSTSNGNSGFRRTSGSPTLQLDTPLFFSRTGTRDANYDLEDSGSYLECAIMRGLFVANFPAYRFYFNAGATWNVSIKVEVII